MIFFQPPSPTYQMCFWWIYKSNSNNALPARACHTNTPELHVGQFQARHIQSIANLHSPYTRKTQKNAKCMKKKLQKPRENPTNPKIPYKFERCQDDAATRDVENTDVFLVFLGFPWCFAMFFGCIFNFFWFFGFGPKLRSRIQNGGSDLWGDLQWHVVYMYHIIFYPYFCYTETQDQRAWFVNVLFWCDTKSPRLPVPDKPWQSSK